MRTPWREVGLSDAEYHELLRLWNGRAPNPLELGLFGAMWSEHCSYKSSRHALSAFGGIASPDMVEGPGGNAGVVRLDPESSLEIAFKIESHNHPSYVEPVEGAATGVGGILRDIFAMGARPIALLDSLRFGTDTASQGIEEGVVEGVGRYGNAIGIPTVGGEVAYGSPYDRHPLVNVMAVGVRRADRRINARGAGPCCRLLLVGQATGRDGIHGASLLASQDVGAEGAGQRSAVQVGDPFTGKLLMEFTLAALECPGVRAIQDLGAAGLTSALSELLVQSAAGADIVLDRVHVREAAMTAYEIMLSESQERMLVAVEPGGVDAVLELARHWDVACHDIGEVVAGDLLRIYYQGDLAAAVPPTLLVERCPRRSAPTPLPGPRTVSAIPSTVEHWVPDVALGVLADPSVRDRSRIYQRYDYTILTNTIQGPWADVAILRLKGERRGLALTVAGPGRWCRQDSFRGAVGIGTRVLVRLSVAGARPLGITDGLNAGNPEDDEVYRDFAAAIHGLAEVCHALGVPVTGGNVSLHNQSLVDGRPVPIWVTPVVGAVGAHPHPYTPRPWRYDQGAYGCRLAWINPCDAGAAALGGSIYLEREDPGAEIAYPAIALDTLKALVMELQDPWWDGLPALRAVGDGGLFATLAKSWLDAAPDAPGIEVDGLPLTPGAFLGAMFGERSDQVLAWVPEDRAAECESRLERRGLGLRWIGRASGSRFSVVAPDSTWNWSRAALTAAFRGKRG